MKAFFSGNLIKTYNEKVNDNNIRGKRYQSCSNINHGLCLKEQSASVTCVDDKDEVTMYTKVLSQRC